MELSGCRVQKLSKQRIQLREYLIHADFRCRADDPLDVIPYLLRKLGKRLLADLEDEVDAEDGRLALLVLHQREFVGFSWGLPIRRLQEVSALGRDELFEVRKFGQTLLGLFRVQPIPGLPLQNHKRPISGRKTRLLTTCDVICANPPLFIFCTAAVTMSMLFLRSSMPSTDSGIWSSVCFIRTGTKCLAGSFEYGGECHLRISSEILALRARRVSLAAAR